MDAFWHVCFWFFGLLSIYSYLVYPAILLLKPARLRPRSNNSINRQPLVTIIVAVHNERLRIRDKLENLLQLESYDGGVEILVVSDASCDGTDELVAEFAEEGIKLIRNPNRDGKEAAQALAISQARGEILIFSDVSTMFDKSVIRDIVDYFRIPSIDAISSTDAFISRNGQVAGESAYVRYEMWLRKQESRVGSLIGLSGSFFSVRAEICRKSWATNIPSDLMTAINCRRQGFDALLAENVIGYYQDLADSRKEYERKVRTVVRGMHALKETGEILNIFPFGFFSFEVWSHKVLRWAVPWALLGLMTASVVLVGTHWVYDVAFSGQAVFYTLGLFGSSAALARRYRLLRIPYFFVMSNVAVAHAAFRFIRGNTSVTWTPSER